MAYMAFVTYLFRLSFICRVLGSLPRSNAYARRGPTVLRATAVHGPYFRKLLEM